MAHSRENGSELPSGYLELTLLFALPVAATVCIFPHLLVRLFLGPQWLAIVPLLPLLAVCGSLQTLLDVARPMFEAVGRPDMQVKLQGAEAILSLVLISTLTFWGGLQGAALAVLVVHATLLAMQFIMLRELIGLGAWEGLATLRQGSLVMLPLLGFGLTGAAFHLQPMIRMGLGGLAVGACAILLWAFLQRYLASLRQPLDIRG